MNGRFLLDTNIVIALFAQEKTVQDRLANANNDIWIGAIAKQHNLTVATRDDHFKEIDDLDLEMW